jgi:hypothetical protein
LTNFGAGEGPLSLGFFVSVADTGVLILNGFGEDGFYEVVIWEGLKILKEFQGPRGGGA